MGRPRSSSGSVVFEVTLLGADGADQEFRAGSSTSRKTPRKKMQFGEKIKVRGVSARCSFSQFYDVIQGFSDRKRELVQETGFGGMLCFPALRMLDRMFIVWLMCRVDALEHCLIIDEDRKIKFAKEDVAHVFGIANRGKTVVGDPRPKKEVVKRVLCDIIGLMDSRNRTIKALLEVITRNYESEMSSRDCVSFKVAFVIYVLSTVLTPGSRFDHVYLDYVHALLVPDEISSYDWSDFVFRKLIDAITHMKIGLRSKNKVANITGCSLFLQVLYLDSIDLGVWTMEHTSFPRVKHFSADRLKYMIRADTLEHTIDCTDRIFGTRELLPPRKVCYTWARCDEVAIVVRPEEMNYSLREATASLARLFNIDNEETADLFHAIAAIHGRDAHSKIVCAVASFLGRFLDSSTTREICNESRVPPLFISQHVGESSVGSRRIMPVQCLRSDLFVTGGGDTGTSVRCNGVGDASIESCDAAMSADQCVDRDKNGNGRDVALVASDVAVVKDPWALGFNFSYTREAAGVMLSEICSLYANFSASSVMGFRPLDVGLLVSELEGNFFATNDIGAGVVDAVLRCIKCRDGSMYRVYGRFRWRHFVGSGFMESLLCGKFESSGAVARFCFDPVCVGYDAFSCKLVFFPARLADRWVCYAWKTVSGQWAVFDPLGTNVARSELLILHARTLHLIRDAVTLLPWFTSSCLLRSDVHSCMELIQTDIRFSRINRSGVSCIYFCCMYDGLCIRGDVTLGELGCEGPVTVAQAFDVLKSYQPFS
ncbi:unnamed protein product [Urochloa decumbens]|uniref:Uncharacterized protein n=1 Tax=Urochloa decumbens TaxID=240449 RepID=A0ABC9CQM1_9POAL